MKNVDTSTLRQGAPCDHQFVSLGRRQSVEYRHETARVENLPWSWTREPAEPPVKAPPAPPQALRKRNLKAMIRLPFTLTLLKKLITSLRGGCFGQYTDLLLETVFLTAFYGFLRGGEFTTRTGSFDPSHDLTIADVSINPHHFSYYSSIQRLMGIGKDPQS